MTIKTKMNAEIKIIMPQGWVVTLNELFAGKEESRAVLARLSFEEKIKMLISLQEIAYNWGQKRDVIVWK